MSLAPRSLFLALLPVLPLAGAEPAGENFAGLLQNSPFGSLATNPAPGNGSGEALEFRSMVVQDGRNYFSIYDPATRRAAWVEMNNPMDGLEVKVFDPARETISLSHQGRLVTLTLKQSRIIVQAPTLSVSAPSKDADQGPPAAVTSEDRRKQMVAAEIQRRRTLRAGATAATR